MTTCDSCGTSIERPIKCQIEGTILSVCNNCTKLGKIIRDAPIRAKPVRYQYIVVSDAPELIKKAREARKMRQVDLAKMLMIKESLLHHIESKQIPLNLHLARKIESNLPITLVKKYKESE